MTEEERQLLRDTADRMARIERALFDVPEGAPADAKPLIEALHILWRAYQRGSFSIKAIMWLALAVTSIGGAIGAAKGWFGGGTP